MIFQKRLKELRNAKGISQVTVATAIEITDRGYRKYEAGDSEPTAGILIKLCRYFEVSADYLLGLSDDPARR